MFKNVLVTGGAGYIGSHVVELLVNKNFRTVVVDNLSKGFDRLVNKKAIFIKADIHNTKLIKEILINYKINTVIHLAALTDVQESQKKKKKYYVNNVEGTKKLMEALKESYVKNLIYSSSAGVYGNTKSPVNENSKTNPINYYSFTKLKGEKIIKFFSKKYKLNNYILRYFNVCGASSSGKIGILSKTNKSLFKELAKQCLKSLPRVSIFGNKFSTTDGTCVRDFIHVSDLAEIHLKLINFSKKNKGFFILNCGYGKGHTVFQIVKKFQKNIKKKIKINFKKPRKGEIIISYANNTKLSKLIKWRPKYNNLDLMVKNSLAWEKSLIRNPKKK